ncbi:hypothetical protein LTR27_008723 [Elasticomyces elasticus]|nr:hypothetical protein LTR27_008723 [Elasticomyces elasticus]
MSQQGGGSAFPFFDRQRGLWYAYDAQHDLIRFQNGQYIPRPPQIPRAMLEGPAPPPPPSQPYHPGSPSQLPANYTHRSPSGSVSGASGYAGSPMLNPKSQPFSPYQGETPRVANTTDQISAGLAATQIGGPSSATASVPGDSSPTTGRPQVQSRFNPQTGVRTTTASGPKQSITDPTLYANKIEAHKFLYGTEGDEERLYSSFKVNKRPERFFIVGRAFLILWSEPAGDNPTLITAQEASDQPLPPGMSTGMYGERVYSKAPEPRWDERPQRGEMGMRSRPIRIVPDEPTDSLDPMSRIDFGKVHTIQHNIKIKPLGMVHPASMDALTSQFFAVWLQPAVSPQPSNVQPRVALAAQPQTSNAVAYRGASTAQESSLPAPEEDESDSDQEDGSEANSSEAGQHEPDTPSSSPMTARSQPTSTEAAQAQNIRLAVSRLVQQGHTLTQAVEAVVQRLMSGNASYTRQSATNIVRARLAHGQPQQAQARAGANEGGAAHDDSGDEAEDSDGDNDDEAEDSGEENDR